MSYSTSIWTSCLVWSSMSLCLINMMLIFPFWAAYHVKKSSTPFYKDTIQPKSSTLPIQLEKHLISNIKYLSFVVHFIVVLFCIGYNLSKTDFILLANIRSTGDMFDIILLLSVIRYTSRNCIFSTALFIPADFFRALLMVSMNLSTRTLLLGWHAEVVICLIVKALQNIQYSPVVN